MFGEIYAEDLIGTSVDGRIVIGRLYTNSDQAYSSVEIDELRFFNQSLSEAQITMLSQLPN